MGDGHSQDDRDADARAAAADIEAVLERRCPELKIAFWAAVDRYYRLDASRAGRPVTGPGTPPDARPSAGRYGAGSPCGRLVAVPGEGDPGERIGAGRPEAP